MYTLRAMELDLKMDRDVIVEDENGKSFHYIVPGGYTITNNSGDEICFDFLQTTWDRDPSDPSIINITVEISDTDLDTVRLCDLENSKWTEFFVYTGEYDEPEIYPVEVKSLNMYFYDSETQEYKEIAATESTLNEINNGALAY